MKHSCIAIRFPSISARRAFSLTLSITQRDAVYQRSERTARPTQWLDPVCCRAPYAPYGRVGRAHCCARPPSEPDGHVSMHPAQASPVDSLAGRSAGLLVLRGYCR